MVRELVPDTLWQRVAPLLPRHRRHRKGGRPFRDDRACLRGILFVLTTGIAWRDLPAEVFGCSGVTCWRRLRAGQQAGVWEALHQALLNEVGHKGHLDWSRASLDASSLRAQKGGRAPVRTRRTAANRARNIIWSSIARGSRSRRGCRRPTSMTARRPSRSSTVSRR